MICLQYASRQKKYNCVPEFKQDKDIPKMGTCIRIANNKQSVVF